MTDLAQLKILFDASPEGRAIAQQRAMGRQIAHVLTDPTTGESFVSHQGGPYERAHAFIEAMINGTEYRDPGEVNPLKAKPSAVSSMLQYLVGHYRKDLLNHPQIDACCDGFASTMRSPNNQKLLRRCKTNYDRWDLMLENLIELMDTMGPV